MQYLKMGTLAKNEVHTYTMLLAFLSGADISNYSNIFRNTKILNLLSKIFFDPFFASVCTSKKGPYFHISFINLLYL